MIFRGDTRALKLAESPIRSRMPSSNETIVPSSFPDLLSSKFLPYILSTGLAAYLLSKLLKPSAIIVRPADMSNPKNIVIIGGVSV